MEFHQITYFLAACDTMNFTRASEVCHVSQPALTVAIRKLEAELDGSLFNREGTTLTLTELGRVMRTHLGRVNETRNSARLAARQIVSEDKEMIDLGMMCTVAPSGLGEAFVAWHTQSRGIELVMHDVWGPKAQELLLSGSLDAAILAHTEQLPKRFDVIPLIQEPMVAAMRADHPLAARPIISSHELKGVSYVDRLRCEFRSVFFRDMKDRDLELDVVLRSEREDWIIEAVSGGIGISIMPLFTARASGLSVCYSEDLKITRSIRLITVHDRPLGPGVKAFQKFLQQFKFDHSTFEPRH